MENAAFRFANLEGPQTQYRGRGSVNISTLQVEQSTAYSESVDLMLTPLTKQGRRLLHQVRRMKAIRDDIRCLQDKEKNLEGTARLQILASTSKASLPNLKMTGLSKTDITKPSSNSLMMI